MTGIDNEDRQDAALVQRRKLGIRHKPKQNCLLE
jgi:hypothetical protein